MNQSKDRIAEAYKWANANRPKVNGYPYLAEALRQAGVQKYVVTLPSNQTIYFTKDGNVVSQAEPLARGLNDIPRFDREAFIIVLKKAQAGDISFPEFLKSTWDTGAEAMVIKLKMP